MTALDKAHTRVTQAQAALDAALETGADTTAARKTLDLAAAELARVQAAATKPVDDSAEQDAIEAEARALVDSAKADIAASTATAIRVLEPVLPVGTAAALIAAQRRAAEHQRTVDAHQARIDGLQSRLDELQAERARIIARRAEGQTEADDGARLELNTADAQGLQDLIARARTEAPGSDLSRVHEYQAAWNAAIAHERNRIDLATCHQLADAFAALVQDLRNRGVLFTGAAVVRHSILGL